MKLTYSHLTILIIMFLMMGETDPAVSIGAYMFGLLIFNGYNEALDDRY